MLTLPDAAAIRAALNQPLDGKLHDILKDTLATAEANGVANLTHVLVVQRGDDQVAIEDELGWSPLEDASGCRFGSSDFRPYWDWLQQDDGYFRLVRCVGNSGFAFVLEIEDAEGVPPDLLRMCRQYVGRPSR